MRELRERNMAVTPENIDKVTAFLDGDTTVTLPPKANSNTTVDTSNGSTTYVRSIGNTGEGGGEDGRLPADSSKLNSAWQAFKRIGYDALTKGGSKAVDFVKQHGGTVAGLAGLGGAAAVGLGAYGLYKGAKALFGKKVKPEDTTYPPPPTDEYIYKPQYPTAPPYRPEAYAPAYPYYPNQSAPTIPYPYPTTPNNPMAIRPSIR